MRRGASLLKTKRGMKVANDFKEIKRLWELNKEINFTADPITEEDIDTLIKIIDEQQKEDFYRNEGFAVFVKGKLILGVHPDNLENNAKHLNNGDMKIDWEYALKYPGLGILYKDTYIQNLFLKIGGGSENE